MEEERAGTLEFGADTRCDGQSNCVAERTAGEPYGIYSVRTRVLSAQSLRCWTLVVAGS